MEKYLKFDDQFGIRLDEENVVVPIDKFVSVIAEKTRWSSTEILKTKDIGDVEIRLNVQAKKPNNLKSLKRGKSMSDLYRLVDQEEKKVVEELITNISDK